MNCPVCSTKMLMQRAGRTNYKETMHCPKCDHYIEGPCSCESCHPIHRCNDCGRVWYNCVCKHEDL